MTSFAVPSTMANVISPLAMGSLSVDPTIQKLIDLLAAQQSNLPKVTGGGDGGPAKRADGQGGTMVDEKSAANAGPVKKGKSKKSSGEPLPAGPQDPNQINVQFSENKDLAVRLERQRLQSQISQERHSARMADPKWADAFRYNTYQKKLKEGFSNTALDEAKAANPTSFSESAGYTGGVPQRRTQASFGTQPQGSGCSQFRQANRAAAHYNTTQALAGGMDPNLAVTSAPGRAEAGILLQQYRQSMLAGNQMEASEIEGQLLNLIGEPPMPGPG